MSNKTLILIFLGTALILLLGLFFLTAWWWNNFEQLTVVENPAINENIFEPAIINKLELEPEEIKFIAVGDVMLSRVVGQRMITKNDYNYPFLQVADYLKDADLAVANLETAITPGRIIKTNEMAFRADPETAPALRSNNFQILSLANNHTPNFGEAGLKNTFEYLTSAGIIYVGAGENIEQAQAPKFTEINGIKIAWLARTEQLMVPENYEAGEKRAGTAFTDQAEIIEAIKKAKEQADLVILLLHAGIEYVPEPNQEQINLAHVAIEAGAEMVIGHHPHVVQSAEKYQGKYIFYSLGNFVFDQMWSRETREGLALKITLVKEGIKEIEATAVLIEDYSQPKIISGEEGEKIIKRLGLTFEKKENFYIIK